MTKSDYPSDNRPKSTGVLTSTVKSFACPASRDQLGTRRRLAGALGFLLLATTAHATMPTGNLLVNGSGSADLSTGWSVIANGGSGWARFTTGGYDATQGFFVTSYAWGRRSQTVDLLALGATAEELDANPPVIRVSEAISSYLQGAADKYYLRVELRGETNNVIASWDGGTQTAPRTATSAWVVEQGELKNYGPGVRFIYFEDGGIDSGYWDGPFGTYHDAASITLVTDNDNDGIPNDWESANGTNPNVNDAAADPDSDGLANLDEYGLGTKPTVPDTDADGLLDGVEDLFGTWATADATGTHPLSPDTDGDGLLDGVENPDLPYVGLSQTGTNPHQQDSDGDGLPDLAEITHGSDPTATGDVAVFSYPSTVLADNFDGAAVNSTYTFTQSAGAFVPAKTDSGLATNGNAVRLTNLSGSISNSVAWDTVPSLANAVRVTFDFRMSADSGGEAADGFGIGFFKTANHGTTGPANPGYRPTGDVAWENPTSDFGFPGGVVVGFDIYGGTTEGNTVRVTGPLAPRPAVASAVPSFQLNEGVFHRVTLTAIKNGPDSTALSVDITRDVNGASPTSFSLVKGVVVKGFDISADAFRLIAGGRTGGSTVTTDLDNLSVTSSTVLPPAPVLVSHSFDRTTNPPEFVLTWTSEPSLEYTVEASTDLGATGWNVVKATVPSGGETTTTSIPVPIGSPLMNFYRVKLKP